MQIWAFMKWNPKEKSTTIITELKKILNIFILFYEVIIDTTNFHSIEKDLPSKNYNY